MADGCPVLPCGLSKAAAHSSLPLLLLLVQLLLLHEGCAVGLQVVRVHWQLQGLGQGCMLPAMLGPVLTTFSPASATRLVHLEAHALPHMLRGPWLRICALHIRLGGEPHSSTALG